MNDNDSRTANEQELFDSQKIDMDRFLRDDVSYENQTDSEDMVIDEESLAMLQGMNDDTKCDMKCIAVPQELILSDYTGPVYGFVRPETGYHVLYGWDRRMVCDELGVQLVGYISSDFEEIRTNLKQNNLKNAIVGIRNGEKLQIYYIRDDVDIDSVNLNDLTELKQEIYTFTKNLFSRNAGLIETDWMNDVCAFISGCGSVGGLVALQLARSGVGRFVLIDEDCVEIHNVCRHQCGLWDVGRKKVEAIRERILRINPNAEVICFAKKFQEVSWPYGKEEWLDPKKAIFIGTCDNRVGNAFVCDAAYENKIPFAALGFNTRAWGGEIFTCLPEKHEVCYRCAFKTQIEQSIAEERQNHDYIDSADVGKVSFEPGLDVDIEYGVSLFDKVILDMINRHNSDYHPRIYHTLTQYTFFSGTDQKPEEFWRAHLKEPISMKNVRFSDKVRRCSYCMSEHE